MNKFKIEVTFSQSAFTRHNIQRNSVITGIIELTTDRCDVEPILVDYKVASYKIVDCDNKLQIMNGYRCISDYYHD